MEETDEFEIAALAGIERNPSYQPRDVGLTLQALYCAPTALFAMKPTGASSFRVKAARPEHPLAWLAEPLADEASFVLKSWFGGRTIMLHGKHQLFLTTQGEPWQGVLVCTFHEHQPSLRAEFPALVQHPILKKWLYLPESAETFERDARQLIRLAKARDPRLGIPPSPKKRRKIKRVRFGDSL